MLIEALIVFGGCNWYLLDKSGMLRRTAADQKQPFNDVYRTRGESFSLLKHVTWKWLHPCLFLRSNIAHNPDIKIDVLIGRL